MYVTMELTVHIRCHCKGFIDFSCGIILRPVIGGDCRKGVDLWDGQRRRKWTKASWQIA